MYFLLLTSGVSAGVLLEEEGRSHRRALQPYRGCLSQVRLGLAICGGVEPLPC